VYVIFMFVLTVLPEQCVCFARQAMQIWAKNVVPSLFPYMVMCRLLSNELKRMNVPVKLSVTVLGLFGGSPAGASVLAGYDGQMTKKELHSLCALTGTISPMFFLSTVTDWAKDLRLGLLLLTSNIFGAVISSAFINVFHGRNYDQRRIERHLRVSSESDPLHQSITAILIVGGNIVLFSVMAGYLSFIPLLSPCVHAVLHAMLETAGGVYVLSQIPMPFEHRAVLIAFTSGFGGLSILFQNLSFLKTYGIRLKHLLVYGMIRACTGALIMFGLIWIIS